jgi:hypothetical protein
VPVLVGAAVAGLIAISGGTKADPPVPAGFPGPLPSFMGGGRAGPAWSPVAAEKRWLAQAQALAPAAPLWARRMYWRSLLVLRAAIDPRTGAAVAGARPGWAYVWPRDAGTAAIALAAAGYRPEARRVARFLLRLDLDAAARFEVDGEPVEGREAQGDAAGWVAAAARAAGLDAVAPTWRWRDRADYQEKDQGTYLGNAIASARRPRAWRAFVTARGLVRVANDPGSGLDTAAAWAVRPFPCPALFPLVRRTLLRFAGASGPYGLLPSEHWDGGEEPWTAPTAWTAWGLAALARVDRRRGARSLARQERRAALTLIAALRRAATRRGLLPERVDAKTGAPRSTTPLVWSHAFAALALRELWPRRAGV